MGDVNLQCIWRLPGIFPSAICTKCRKTLPQRRSVPESSLPESVFDDIAENLSALNLVSVLHLITLRSWKK